MNMIERARNDWKRFSGDSNGWGETIVLTSSGASPLTVNVTGLSTKHNIGINSDGNLINTKNAHISISEKILTDLNYPVRNASGEVAMIGHKVSVKDSTGILKNYIIKENFPDETVGVIVFILGDFQ